jgi:hypothetical protein
MIASLDLVAAAAPSRAAREDNSLVRTMTAVVSFPTERFLRKKPIRVTINKNTHDHGG